eukprot:3786381-Rhodomonas_salina.2
MSSCASIWLQCDLRQFEQRVVAERAYGSTTGYAKIGTISKHEGGLLSHLDIMHVFRVDPIPRMRWGVEH